MILSLSQRGASSSHAKLIRAAAQVSRRQGLATAAPPTYHPSRLPPYPKLLASLEKVRAVLDRPLTLSEKILYTHLISPEETLASAGRDASKIRGKMYLPLQVDRLAMQDASAQMALLQFMTCGLDRVSVPASVHCDHLIQAFEGAEADLVRSVASNKEVFDFLESASRKFGIEFWGPGSGIIHQIVLENYAAPGLLMLGTDSHTPNASGLGCLAIGVGGADAVDALTSTPWELMAPRVLSVYLTGQLSPWCTPKDVILHLAGLLTVRGGTGKIIEYSGPGLASLEATGLATMANMGAEVGATTSCFAYTAEMGRYLTATGRDEVRRGAEGAAARGFLAADEGAEYDERIEINLSLLEPCLNGPFTPDLSTPLSQFVERAKSASRNHPVELSAALIGSCTNSSYADMARCASLARQAAERGLKVKTSFDVTPGSEQVRATIERDGIQDILTSVGARVLANACGPCIGQWDRKELQGEDNIILTSFNRNFKGRNDGNVKTMNLLASPEIVTAMAFAGRMDFNPMVDSIMAPDGKPFHFQPPQGEQLPSNGFVPGDIGYLPQAMPEPQAATEVAISPKSSRLEPLKPFVSPFAESSMTGNYELPAMRCLVRIKGKCTTDAISAAGPWLRFKGHLTNIAENTLIGATNGENDKMNSVVDFVSGTKEEVSIPTLAKKLKANGQPWMVVADHNYGEGSAREHAALQIRFYNGYLILARSIARIAETNLRKQGVLTLLFENEADYDRIASGDQVETVNLSDLIKPGGDSSTQVKVRVTKFNDDGSVKDTFEIGTKHSLSPAHLNWIRAGSALNLIREKAAEGTSSSPPLSQSSVSSSKGKQQVRGYATQAGAKSTASKSNPNDSRNVGSASDNRIDGLRKLVFPPLESQNASVAENFAKRDEQAEKSLQELMPYPAEVHDTITRAWLLYQREERQERERDLKVKRERLVEACESLKQEAPAIFARASYKVAMTKRHPDEMEKLQKMGLKGDKNVDPTMSNQERRRRVKSVVSSRIHGLMPREMKAPTMTPSSKGWPAFTGTKETK
jgi:homoaconitase